MPARRCASRARPTRVALHRLPVAQGFTGTPLLRLALLPRLALLLLLTLALGACTHHAAHPVIGGPWGAGRPVAGAGGPAADPTLDQGMPWEARAAFFGDMGRLDARLQEVRALLAPEGSVPLGRSLREAAQSLHARMGPRGPLGGRLRNVLVYGAVGRLPLPPRAAAALWLDPSVQGAALGTRGFSRESVVFDLPDAFRQAARVELLDVGKKPLTIDLVFGAFLEVKQLFDNTVLLRYDPRPVSGARHVTLWRGGCIFEPDGSGCIATEVVIFGTDVSLPLLGGKLRQEVEKAFSVRAQRLWRIAHEIAAKGPSPAR